MGGSFEWHNTSLWLDTGRYLHLRKTFSSNLGNANLMSSKEEWNYSSAVGEFPTNAFGDIEFINEDEGSSKTAK